MIVQAMLAGEANFAGLAGPAVVSSVVVIGDVIQIAAVVKTFTVPMFSAPYIKEGAQLKIKKWRTTGSARFHISPRRTSSRKLESLISQKSIDEAASKKLPITAYFDHRFVNELEKEGFFKKPWQSRRPALRLIGYNDSTWLGSEPSTTRPSPKRVAEK